jgi:hypothetical protein
LCSFYLQGYYDNIEQLVSLLVQASQQDFYFSHRIWFFFKSVLFNKIVDKEKEEQQRIATDTLMKAIFAMIVENDEDVN